MKHDTCYFFLQPTAKELQDLQNTRISKKKTRQEEFVELRKQQATELLRDILEDKPELPAETTPRVDRSPRGKEKLASPRSARATARAAARTQKGKSMKDSRQIPPPPPGSRTMTLRNRTPSPKGADRFVSPATRRERNDLDRMDVQVESYMNVKYSYEEVPEQVEEPTKKFATRTRSIPQRSDFSPQRPQGKEQRPATASQQKQASPKQQKKLEEMVRLQRPEVTRSKGRRAPTKAVPYVDRLAEMNSTAGAESTARSGSTQRSQQKIYGE